MSSSQERILSKRRRDWRALALCSIAIISVAAFAVACIWVLFEPSLRSRLTLSVGLAFDIVGVVLVGLTLVRPYQDPTDADTQFLSHHEPWRTQAVVAHQERLVLPMQIGLCAIVAGFVLQVISAWL